MDRLGQTLVESIGRARQKCADQEKVVLEAYKKFRNEKNRWRKLIDEWLSAEMKKDPIDESFVLDFYYRFNVRASGYSDSELKILNSLLSEVIQERFFKSNKFVAFSKPKARSYHTRDCVWLSGIPVKKLFRLIRFKTRAQAERQEYLPCEFCTK